MTKGTSRTTRSASQGTSATRSIPQNTSDIHWKSLSPNTRQHIHDLVLSSVPVVLNSIRGTKRKANLQELLDKLITKIDEKLETHQVPKSSKNSNFDYSKLHSQNRALELTLAQELEQISQMELQLEHEKLLLKEDSKSLAKFCSDKKAVDSRNKMLQRNKLHPLLKEEIEDVNTQTIDDLVNEIDEAENSLLQLMKNVGLEDKFVEK
ncbi:10465_t:CDS:2, partial [Funneliformis geosporum]